MPWPLSQDYNEAAQTPVQSFSDAELKQAEAKGNAGCQAFAAHRSRAWLSRAAERARLSSPQDPSPSPRGVKADTPRFGIGVRSWCFSSG
jgi:hypothetical protein